MHNQAQGGGGKIIGEKPSRDKERGIGEWWNAQLREWGGKDDNKKSSKGGK